MSFKIEIAIASRLMSLSNMTLSSAAPKVLVKTTLIFQVPIFVADSLNFYSVKDRVCSINFEAVSE
jgi:hypothetical protein